MQYYREPACDKVKENWLVRDEVKGNLWILPTLFLIFKFHGVKHRVFSEGIISRNLELELLRFPSAMPCKFLRYLM